MVTYCFVDAANLFYGGEKSLGWKIDYKKLFLYLKTKYKVRKVFYYAGVELHGFSYSVLDEEPIGLGLLLKHLGNQLKNYNKRHVSQKKRELLEKHIARAKFYRKLKQFGYTLRLKPVKTYRQSDGSYEKKANCDVDMTFELMKYIKEYSGVVVLSGDGDFAVVLKHLVNTKRS